MAPRQAQYDSIDTGNNLDGVCRIKVALLYFDLLGYTNIYKHSNKHMDRNEYNVGKMTEMKGFCLDEFVIINYSYTK